MSTITKTSAKNTIAYFMSGQVLFLLGARSSQNVFPDGIVESDMLTAVANACSEKFPDKTSGRYVYLGALQETHTVLMQLTLEDWDDERIANFIANMSLRIAKSNNKQIPVPIGSIPGLYIRAVAPNWLSGGAQTIGTGGPGTKPSKHVRHTPGADVFACDELSAHLVSIGKTPHGKTDWKPVDVFILDSMPGHPTSLTPTPPDIDSAPQSDFSDNDELGRLWLARMTNGPTSGVLETVNNHGDTELASIWADQTILPSLSAYRIEGHDYDMSDHGLFIAAIVKRIAPGACIYLIQVLNDYGIGTVASIAAGFRHILNLHEKRADVPFIVSCSFTMTVPVLAEVRAAAPGTERLDVTAHETTDLPQSLIDLLSFRFDRKVSTDQFDAMIKRVGLDPKGNFTEANAADAGRLITDDLSKAIMSVVIECGEGCSLVAAAGNDSEMSSRKKPPTIKAACYPARLTEALGVGALDGNNHRATYSNHPDTPISDGLMTLGSVSSLFSKHIPHGQAGGDHGTGYAEWAGTSFATPIIAGLLALQVSEYGCDLNTAKANLFDSAKSIEGQTGGRVVKVTQI